VSDKEESPSAFSSSIRYLRRDEVEAGPVIGNG
jgi:hypothetical protein